MRVKVLSLQANLILCVNETSVIYGVILIRT
nr:MAG TPA: hypothetical protein [Caudoviricetes sp.]